MMPFRAIRSSRVTAFARSSAVAPSVFAFLRAVRRAERCARFRTVAARDFRMFFFAEAIFGTKTLQERGVLIEQRSQARYWRRLPKSSRFDRPMIASVAASVYQRAFDCW